MVNQLIEILGKEAALFESFLDLLEKQKASLVANDLDALRNVTEQQQQLMSLSRELASQREAVTMRIRRENDIHEDLTISRLLETVDAERADRLTDLRDTILGLNDSIAQVRNSNAMLLNQSRQFISKTMSALSRIANPESTYNMRPGPNNARATVVVDRRA